MSKVATFRVHNAVLDQFPTYVVALVEVRASHSPETSDKLAKLREDALERHLASFGDTDLKELQPIKAWRDAFSIAGWSASRFPSSVEALAKRAVRAKKLPEIMPLVDLASVAALTYLVPIGTHDVESFHGSQLEVRHATIDDSFVPPGSIDDVELPPATEIVYATGRDVRTRRWVWRQSETALISSGSTHVIYPVDGFADMTRSRVEAAAEFLASTAGQIFDAYTSLHWVGQESPSAEL